MTPQSMSRSSRSDDASHPWPVWKTIRIVKAKTRDDWVVLFHSAKIKLAYEVYEVLRRYHEYSLRLVSVKLVIVSNAELGYPNGCTVSQTLRTGKRMGLGLCSPLVGLELRRHYLDQPKGEWLRIAMKGVRDSAGMLDYFVIGRDEKGLWLDSHWYRPRSTIILGGDTRWVFVLP